MANDNPSTAPATAETHEATAEVKTVRRHPSRLVPLGVFAIIVVVFAGLASVPSAVLRAVKAEDANVKANSQLAAQARDLANLATLRATVIDQKARLNEYDLAFSAFKVEVPEVVAPSDALRAYKELQLAANKARRDLALAHKAHKKREEQWIAWAESEFDPMQRRLASLENENKEKTRLLKQCQARQTGKQILSTSPAKLPEANGWCAVASTPAISFDFGGCVCSGPVLNIGL